MGSPSTLGRGSAGFLLLCGRRAGCARLAGRASGSRKVEGDADADGATGGVGERQRRQRELDAASDGEAGRAALFHHAARELLALRVERVLPDPPRAGRIGGRWRERVPAARAERRPARRESARDLVDGETLDVVAWRGGLEQREAQLRGATRRSRRGRRAAANGRGGARRRHARGRQREWTRSTRLRDRLARRGRHARGGSRRETEPEPDADQKPGERDRDEDRVRGGNGSQGRFRRPREPRGRERPSPPCGAARGHVRASSSPPAGPRWGRSRRSR